MSEDFKAKITKGSDTEKKPKKVNKKGKVKMSCWGKCAITSLVIIVMLVSAVMGAAFWAWGKYAKPSMNMSLPRFIGILSSGFSYNEKKIVANPYNKETDLNNFYSNLKGKMMLSSDAEIKINDILSGALAGNGSDNSTSQTNQQKYIGTMGYDYQPLQTLEQTPVTEENASGNFTTGNGAIDAFLKDLKFDFSSLANYKGEPFILEWTDRQVAAFLNEVLTSAISGQFIPAIKEIETQYNITLSEIISLQQVLIDSRTVNNTAHPRLKITLRLDIREAVKAYLSTTTVPLFVASLLPKRIYVSASVYPTSPDMPLEIGFNNITEQDFSDLIQGVENIMQEFGGQSLGINDMMININDMIVQSIAKVADILPISFVETGSIQTQPIRALMNLLNLSINEGQFLTMLRDIKLPTIESLGFDKFTDEMRNASVSSLITEISTKYGLGPQLSQSITPENAFTQVKNVVSDPNFVNNINLKDTFDYKAQYEDIEDQSRIWSRYTAFAGLMNSYFAQNPTMLGGIDIKALDCSFLSNDNTVFGQDKPATDVLSMLIQINIHSMLKIDTSTLIGSLMGQLVPANLFLQVYIDMGKEENGYVPNSAAISINGKSIAVSKGHIDTVNQLINTFSSSMNFSYEYLGNTINKALKESIKSIETSLNSTIEFRSDYLVLPSIFEIVSGTKYVNPDTLTPQDKRYSAADIFNSFAIMYEHNPNSEYNINVDQHVNAGHFARELENKFYIKNADEFIDTDGQSVLGETGDKLFDSLQNLAANFQNKISVDRMNNDTAELEDLKPIMMQEELGYIISKKANFNISFLKDFQAIESRIEKRVDDQLNEEIILSLVLKGRINAGVAEDGITPKYKYILPDWIYMKVQINMTVLQSIIKDPMIINAGNTVTKELLEGVAQGKNIIESLTINNLNDTQLGSDGMTDLGRFMGLISRLVNKPINMNDIKKELEVTVVNFMGSINASGSLSIKFEEGSVVIETTVFDLAVKQIYKDGAVIVPNAQEFRQTIKKACVVPESLMNAEYGDAQKVVSQINSKYFLTDSGQLTFDKVTYKADGVTPEVDENGKPITTPMTPQEIKDANILQILGDKKLDERYAEIVDGKKMAEDNTSLDDLKPFFSIQELARLLKGSLGMNSGGIQDTDLLRIINIPSQDLTSQPYLTLLLGGKIQTENSTYGAFIPSDIRITVNINYSKLKDDIGKTEEQIDALPDIPNYCTFIINDMSDTDDSTSVEPFKGNDMACFVSLMNKVSGKAFDLDTINKEISKKVRVQMRAFTNGVQLNFKDNGVELGNIYEIAVASMKNYEEMIPEDQRTTPQSLRVAFKDLYTEVPQYGLKANIKADGSMDYSIYSDNPNNSYLSYQISMGPPPTASANVKVNESRIGYAIKEQLPIFAKDNMNNIGENAIRLRQVGLRATGLTPIYIGDTSTKINESTIIITIDVESKAVLGKPNTLLPEHISATLMWGVSSTSQSESSALVLGNVTSAGMGTLKRLLQANLPKSDGGSQMGNIDSIFGSGVANGMVDNIKNKEIVKVKVETTILDQPRSAEQPINVGTIMKNGIISQIGKTNWIGYAVQLNLSN